MLSAAGNHVPIPCVLGNRPWQDGIFSVMFLLAFDTTHEISQKEEEIACEKGGGFQRQRQTWMQTEPTDLSVSLGRAPKVQASHETVQMEGKTQTQTASALANSR